MAPFVADLAITSPTIPWLGVIPTEHSAEGDNAVPTIQLRGAPSGTHEFALVCHDPDAPLPRGFTHWTVYGIPGDTSVVDLSKPGVRQGSNSLGETGWSGPYPPGGHGPHHYYFWVYALSQPVENTPTREEFLDQYADSIIEQARLIGTFERK